MNKMQTLFFIRHFVRSQAIGLTLIFTFIILNEKAYGAGHSCVKLFDYTDPSDYESKIINRLEELGLSLIPENANRPVIDITQTALLPLAGQSFYLESEKRTQWLEFIKFLINRGADVNGFNDKGSTIFHFAVLAKSEELIKLLLEKGANPLLKKLAIEISAFELSLTHAQDLVYFIIDNLKDINVTDPWGNSLLMVAIQQSETDVAEYLIYEKGINIRLRNKAGINSLGMTLKENYYHLSRLLIEKGIDFQSPQKDGMTPLMIAADKCDIDMVKYLLKKGAEVNFRSPATNKTAIYYGSARVMEALIKAGATIDAKDNSGNTVLIQSVSMKSKEKVKLLISSKKANLNHQNKDGDTALHIAIKKYQPALAKQLIDAEADIYLKNKADQSPMDLAKKLDYLDILNELQKRDLVLGQERGVYGQVVSFPMK